MPKMQITEAINALSDGHTIWKPSYAKRVCEAIGIDYQPKLECKFRSENDPLGAHMYAGQEDTIGVYALDLSEYAAKQLGVKDKAESKIGRGSQARAYAKVIADKLGISNNL